MEEEMRFITVINAPLSQWENGDQALTNQLIIAYSKLLFDNKLNPYDYRAILGWTYENDDFVKNRITLVIEAKPVLEVADSGNYKDVKSESR